jgi:hypothetical protein
MRHHARYRPAGQGRVAVSLNLPNPTPYSAAAHAATASISLRNLAMLNEAITGQVMLAVSPLILLLRKPSPAN